MKLKFLAVLTLMPVLAFAYEGSAFSKAATYNGVVYGDDDVSVFQIKTTKISRKGQIRISGSITTLDGKKKTIRSQTVDVWDGYAYMEFSIPKFIDYGVIEITEDGELWGDCDIGEFYLADIGGDLMDNPALFYVEDEDYCFGNAIKAKEPKKFVCSETCLVERYAEIYTVNGKWKVVPEFSSDNLKLSYSKKTGVFKGSFRCYGTGQPGCKSQYVVINVNGFVIDGCGYGRATYKGVTESAPVYIDMGY